MGRLSGKTALVTAAAQGMGRAAAEAFLREGATVIATDVRLDLLDGFAGVVLRQLDVTDPVAVMDIAAEFPEIDVLYNCAGVVHAGTILDCSDADWELAFALNVTAQFRMIRAVLPGMLARGSGSIINMASVAALKGVANRLAYGASKAAVIGLTKAVAADHVKQGIRCNAICPGTIDTPSLQQRMRDTGDYEKGRAAFLARQPSGRLGTPEELAAFAVYLASDESTFTTGQAHIIDGGWLN
ncbi:short chain dehydrogenase family protein [Asticcacaulis biprosthecium C19]|uniref:D-xylose 1-dehydrogenase n=1 Tax=Asticcacaulis biprosthecium C19 TaxID=715226 RepID=F4QSD8_9CAUL|nr:SDR family oxidoreductase [Asticcacaulis biprosthecium]EGF89658.1 short chain dehydrogenase family protein [Asticcacaulis biprosthecium C19]